MAKDKRYAVTMQLYIHAKDDLQAKLFANNLANVVDRINDNKCAVTHLAEAPHGSIEKRAIL